MAAPFTPEDGIARCRRAAAALISGASRTPREVLAQELADLLRLLEASTVQADGETRRWVVAEIAAVRSSVLTPAIVADPPGWATVLLCSNGVRDALDEGG